MWRCYHNLRCCYRRSRDDGIVYFSMFLQQNVCVSSKFLHLSSESSLRFILEAFQFFSSCNLEFLTIEQLKWETFHHHAENSLHLLLLQSVIKLEVSHDDNVEKNLRETESKQLISLHFTRVFNNSVRSYGTIPSSSCSKCYFVKNQVEIIMKFFLMNYKFAIRSPRERLAMCLEYNEWV